MLPWLSVWNEVQTCICPSWCHCHSLSLASVKSRLVLPFCYRAHLGSPGKRVVKRVCVCRLSLWTLVVRYKWMNEWMTTMHLNSWQQSCWYCVLDAAYCYRYHNVLWSMSIRWHLVTEVWWEETAKRSWSWTDLCGPKEPCRPTRWESRSPRAMAL